MCKCVCLSGSRKKKKGVCRERKMVLIKTGNRMTVARKVRNKGRDDKDNKAASERGTESE